MEQILKIKVNLPPLGSNMLVRKRILKELNQDLYVQGLTSQLSLISAPAGFGKTTLALQMLMGKSNKAWYTIDQEDNDPAGFWVYLISALQSIDPDIGKGSLELANSKAFSSTQSSNKDILTLLLNALFDYQQPIVLVLDDYHLIDNPQIHQDMEFFIENLPPSFHLVITTRSDPPFPLSRWRSRGKMREVRLDNLKFSREEAIHLYNQLNLDLSASQVETLSKKTEGWVTGLRLAASSLAASPDKDKFIEEFAGSNRQILHFLSEEVFSNQPGHIQEFLLETSILGRLCGPLCNAITGRTDSASLLETLEGSNLFLIPLDQGTWYRYHPLFSDLLNLQLKRRSPDRVDQLHHQATLWYLEENMPGEAIRHALLGNDLDSVAKILHLHYDDVMRSAGWGHLSHCLNTLPLEYFKRYPRLAVHKAFNRLLRQGQEEAKEYLRLAKGLSYPGEDQEEYLGMMAAVETYLDIYDHNFPSAVKNAEKSLELLPLSNHYWRMLISIFYGDTNLFGGNPREAYTYYVNGHRDSQKLNNTFAFLTTGFKVCTSLYYRGRLAQSMELTHDLLGLAKEKGLSMAPRVALLWSVRSDLLRERGELAEAGRCVERGLRANEPEIPSLGWNYLSRIALSFSLGEYREALLAVAKVEELHKEYNLPIFVTSPTAAWKARILMRMGDLEEAEKSLGEVGITEDSPVTGGHERAYLSQARILVQQKNFHKAREILTGIEKLADRGENVGILLDCQLVLASLEEALGNSRAAEAKLLAVINTGEKHGYSQIFRDQEGLDSVFNRIKHRPFRSDDDKHQGQSLVEELTGRELEILDLISQGLSNREISNKLFLSPGTVKWYTSSIYGKLGVKNRAQSVIRSQELNLLGRTL